MDDIKNSHREEYFKESTSDKNLADEQLNISAPFKSQRNHKEIENVLEDLKQQMKEKHLQSERKHQEEIQILTKKYNQIKEQLRLQQELYQNKEHSEQYLQEQLNKNTIELAQLRLARDDLNSALKSVSTQKEFLTKELEKIKATNIKKENVRQQDVGLMQQQLISAQIQIDSLQNDYKVNVGKLENEKKSLKAQLIQARKQIDSVQDENFRILKESKETAAIFESNKIEISKFQQHNSELQIKCTKLNQDIEKLKEENSCLKDSNIKFQSEYESISAEKQRISNSYCVLQQNFDTLSNELKSKSDLIRKLTLEQQENINQIQILKNDLDKIKRNAQKEQFKADQENKINKERVSQDNQIIRTVQEENNNLIDKISQIEQNLRNEQVTREKAEKNIENFMKQAAQYEDIITAANEERNTLKAQIQDLMNSLQQKGLKIEEEVQKRNELFQEKSDIQIQLKHAKMIISEIRKKNQLLESQSQKNMNEEYLMKINELESSNTKYCHQIKNLQDDLMKTSQLKEDYEKTIDELHAIIQKERIQISENIKERTETEELNKVLKKDNVTLKHSISELQSVIEIAKAENKTLKDQLNAKIQKSMKSISEKEHLQQLFNDQAAKLNEYELNKEQLISVQNNDRKTIQALNDEIISIKSKYESTLNKNEILENKIQAIQSAYEVSKTDYRKYQQQIEDFNKAINSTKAELLQEREKNEAITTKITVLDNQFKDISSINQNQREQIQKMQNECTEKAGNITRLELQVKQLKNNIIQLTTENEALSSEKSRWIKRATSSEAMLKDALKSNFEIQLNPINTTNSKNSDEQVDIEQFKKTQDQIKQMQKKISDDNTIISNLKQQITIMKNKEDQLINENFEINRQNTNYSSLIDGLEQSNKDLQAIIDQLRNEKKELSQNIENLETKIETVSLHADVELKKKLETIQNNYKQSQISLTNEKLAAFEKIKSLETTNQDLSTQIKNLKLEGDKIRNELEETLSKLSFSSKQKELIMKENDDLKKEIASQTKDYVALQTRIGLVNDERDKLINKVHSLKKNEEISNQKLVNNCALQSQIFSLEEDNNLLKSQLEKTQFTIQKLQESLNSLKKEKDEAQKEILNLNSIVTKIQVELDTNYSFTPNFDENLSQSKKTTSQICKALQTLREFLLHAQQDIQNLASQKMQLSNEIIKMEKNLQKRNEENEKIKFDYKLLNKKFESAMNELTSIQKQHKQMVAEKSHLDSGITKLRTALQKTKQRLVDVEEEKDELKKEITRLQIENDEISFHNSFH